MLDAIILSQLSILASCFGFLLANRDLRWLHPAAQ